MRIKLVDNYSRYYTTVPVTRAHHMPHLPALSRFIYHGGTFMPTEFCARQAGKEYFHTDKKRSTFHFLLWLR